MRYTTRIGRGSEPEMMTSLLDNADLTIGVAGRIPKTGQRARVTLDIRTNETSVNARFLVPMKDTPVPWVAQRAMVNAVMTLYETMMEILCGSCSADLARIKDPTWDYCGQAEYYFYRDESGEFHVAVHIPDAKESERYIAPECAMIARAFVAAYETIAEDELRLV